MGKIRLITGGMRSGKSSYVESILETVEGKVLYIATAKVTDEEMEERVRIHQGRRGSRYRTYEGYKNLNDIIEQASEKHVMIECFGTLITNLMFDCYHEFELLNMEDIHKMEEKIMKEVKSLVKVFNEREKNYWLITNEVGLALVSEYKLGRIYTDILGRVNQMLAAEADEVILMVCGLPMKIKETLT